MENHFEALLHKGHATHLRDTLTKRGTMLDDILIQQLFYLMAWKKGYSPEQVRIVDPVLLESALHTPGQQDNVRHVKRVFTDLPLPPLILLPLVGSTHWSLLLYRTRHHRWYHLDSLAPYHSELARTTVKALKSAQGAKGSISLHTVAHLPRQDALWECGLYTLEYIIFAVESSLRAGTDESAFHKHLTQHAELACEGNLLLFTENLLKLLE
jgi:Ulp1 family protease